MIMVGFVSQTSKGSFDCRESQHGYCMYNIEWGFWRVCMLLWAFFRWWTGIWYDWEITYPSSCHLQKKKWVWIFWWALLCTTNYKQILGKRRK